MAFTTLMMAHAPDADKDRHRCVIETPKYYKLIVVVVRNQQEAVEVARDAVEREGVRSILLCPGFTHADVAEIAMAVGKDVGVAVARGDGPSSRASLKAMTEAGWFAAGNTA